MKKNILFFIVLFCFMQQKGFSQQVNDQETWTQIDTLEKKGLYRSAWDKVKQIYTRAVKNGNSEQELKALIYQLKYRSKIEEEANGTNIREVDSLAARSSGIKKAILRSMLAEMYRDYMQANRYTLYNRITSGGEDEKDIATWSLAHLYNKIGECYRSSLQDEERLQHVQLKTLSVLVDTGKNTLDLRPTLFDLLAHRALDYFTGEEQNVIRPATHFMIDRAAAFDPALTFSSIRLAEEDTADLSYNVLLLYKQLIKFHLNDKDPAALIDVDLQRLQFVYRKAVMTNKDSLYLTALRHIVDQYGGPSAPQAVYLLAQWHYQQGMQYDVLTHPRGKDELVRALELCNSIAAKPSSSAAIRARQLKDDILRTALSLQVEEVNVPGKPFRVLVTYKNASTLSFRLVELPQAPAVVFANKNPDLDDLLKRKPLKNWEQAFPDPGDHQSHRAEMKVDALPAGRYALLVSDNSDLGGKKSTVESVVFYVSHIGYVQNGQGRFLVLNRETGEPLPQARVKLWYVKYNQDKRKNDLVLFDTCRTGQDGSFRIKMDKTYRSLMPEIDWENDRLFTGRSQWIPYAFSGETEKDTTVQKTYLFTDRAIYRPGQTVYFKGITFDYSLPGHRGRAVAGKRDTILLKDANNQEIDALPVVSNDYGSYAGSFVLPKALLNGTMTLRTENGRAITSFSVEEYKRPTFYLQWDTASQKYRLGDTVSIQGNVLAYSQAVVDGAAVKYRVTRRTRIVFPWYRGMGMIYPPRTEVASIAQGETTTDEKGNFSIQFSAIPDETTDSALNPVFVYEVSVDVTDINGESHPFTYTLPLGYKSLELKWDIADKLSVSDLDSLRLSSTTPAGTFVSTPVTIRLYPLAAPERYIRPRYWEQPDEYIIDQTDYLRYFPHDEYKNESDPETWKRGDQLYSGQKQTDSRGIVSLHTGKLDPGWYALEAVAADESGQEVKTVKYIRLYDQGKKNTDFRDPLWISKNELEAQPGEQVNWLLATDGKTYLFSQDERSDHTGDVVLERWNGEVKHIDFNVDKADYGGIFRHYVTVKYNRVFTENVHIKVPWKNKELHIQYETFRDRLLPGAEEQWKVKVTGEHGDKVSAELLASMYDASLDAIRPHDWRLPELYPVNTGEMNWQGGYGFNPMPSYPVFNPRGPRYPVYPEIYPALKWFGYYYGVSPAAPVAVRGRNVFAASAVARVESHALAQTDALQESVTVGYKGATDSVATSSEEPLMPGLQVRENFNETAFFFPQLHTDKDGDVVFSFTMPEALTRWKLMLFAHTRDMQYGFSEKETVTRKRLMIRANAPRFVRQGDEVVFSAKINNLSAKELSGNARLTLTDLATGEAVNALFQNEDPDQSFAVEAGQSTSVKWRVTVPEKFTGVLGYKLTAIADDYSDGEQHAIPVLTNRVLVTESLPMYFTGNGRHDLNFSAIKKLNGSQTLQPEGITIEYAGNPVWYAVQALPVLDEPEQESADARFNQIYAGLMSRFIAKHIPHFDAVMQQWLTKDTDALKSPLEKNEALKSVLLQETPWVENAQQESAQKKKTAQWYDDHQTEVTLHAAIDRLKKLQLSNGGFSWFKDMPDDRYITQKILLGIGRLMKLGIFAQEGADGLASIIQRGLPYVDARMKEAYDALGNDKEKATLNATDIQYLYMRSFFPDLKPEDSVKQALDFYKKLAASTWIGIDQSVSLRAMIALALNRSGDSATAKAILQSLSETAIKDPVRGMHWKTEPSFYRWYQAPVGAQSVCIEAYEEINQDRKTVDELRNWLLSQKQTNSWPTHAATADAVYALLLTGSAWDFSQPQITVQAGAETFSFDGDHGDAGTQYGKKYIAGKAISADMGNLKVNIKQAAKNQPTWGAMYFQYFENMNKLGNTGRQMSITREISLEKTTPQGPSLIPVGKETSLKVGDKVQVRLVIKAEQDMDYVHLKDVRASCMEPLQTLSGYHWQGGTGYYSSVRDAAVHYYFSHLPRGTYVLTYPVYVTHAGHYTGGMSTLECLYAPSYRAQSEGTEVVVGSR